MRLLLWHALAGKDVPRWQHASTFCWVAMSVMRDETADSHARLDAAKAAAPFVHPRMAPIDQKPAEPEFVPLVERLRAYAKRDAIEAANGSVLKLRADDPG